MDYTARERDADFLMNDVFDIQENWSQIEAYQELSPDLVKAVIAEGGRLASEVMAPLNEVGDQYGCELKDGEVTTPPGFKEAFAEITQGGWLGLSGNPAFGGQGMPKSLAGLIEEMFWAANSSLFLYGSLTVGACLSIDAHGSAEQKQTYLEKLYSGEWTGAMALTESHAGTDLGMMRTKAEPQADGSYRITGTKIFITSGEHDMAENIVHLTLARIVDGPKGTKGISLFIVPKYVPESDGSLGPRNGWASGSLEHKMGIKGSATSVINYDGAQGFLLGEEHQGLAAMFTMMNYERLSVGLQGLGAGDLAYQHSARYAQDRIQGRSATGAQNPDADADSLLVHPDVRRMLLTQRAYVDGCRAFAFFAGMQLDEAKHNGDARAERFGQLLNPVVEAFLNDHGLDAAVVAPQGFGGHGCVTEWGGAQTGRDAGSPQITGGANGIQALDLAGRKVVRDGGKTLRELLEVLSTFDIDPGFQQPVEEAFARLVRVTDSMVARSNEDANLPGAVSTDYLDLMGTTLCAWAWGVMVRKAGDDEFGTAKKQTARLLFARVLPRTIGVEHSMLADSDVLMDMPEALFKA